MISEAGYLDQIRSCAKFNKRLISQRRRPYPFFDQQTGIAQRPSNHLVRHISDRCPTRSPLEAYRYTAHKWKANSKVSFDSVEFKYILGTDPNLKAAVDHLMNPEQSSIPWPTEVSNDSSSASKFSGGRTNFEHVEVEDFEQDDGEQDHSDEDDWGDKKRKRRRNVQKDVPFKGPSRRGGGSANYTPGPGGVDTRPFVCQECGARYKSRPGLTYHRIHVHENPNNDNTPKSPKRRSPQQSQISDTCDLCHGSKAENKNTGKAEDMIHCKECGRAGHPTCLKFSQNILISTRRHGWQCIECKSCAVCGTSENDEKLLFCDDCDRGFHCYCLNPPLDKPPENDWSCELCQREFGEKASNPANRQ